MELAFAVKILGLARNMIVLNGLVPDKDTPGGLAEIRVLLAISHIVT